MAKESIQWTYENLMSALDQFKAAHSDLPEQRGFLGWTITGGEHPHIKISVSELGAAAFSKNVKVPKDAEAVVAGGKAKLKVLVEIVPLLPSVAPKAGQKPTK